MANVHILLQTPTFTPSQRHRKAIASPATTSAEIKLSDVAISITIIEMKTKAALEADNEHLTS